MSSEIGIDSVRYLEWTKVAWSNTGMGSLANDYFIKTSGSRFGPLERTFRDF